MSASDIPALEGNLYKLLANLQTLTAQLLKLSKKMMVSSSTRMILMLYKPLMLDMTSTENQVRTRHGLHSPRNLDTTA